jgi:hypothetical protein
MNPSDISALRVRLRELRHYRAGPARADAGFIRRRPLCGVARYRLGLLWLACMRVRFGVPGKRKLRQTSPSFVTPFAATRLILESMKSLRPFLTIVCVLVASLAKADQKPSPVGAEQAPSKDGRKLGPMDVRSLLGKGQASGSLPEGMVIRVSACLGEPETKGSGDRLPVEVRETWEFTSGQVRRVRPEDTDDKRSERRAESHPFDSKDLWKDLLEGKAIEIQAAKGDGPEVGFIGSQYQRGGRSIEVVWKGETILNLSETNGPFLKLYRESDARAFGALYDRLATQARNLFTTKAAEAR